jgi:hypothetical protein
MPAPAFESVAHDARLTGSTYVEHANNNSFRPGIPISRHRTAALDPTEKLALRTHAACVDGQKVPRPAELPTAYQSCAPSRSRRLLIIKRHYLLHLGEQLVSALPIGTSAVRALRNSISFAPNLEFDPSTRASTPDSAAPHVPIARLTG